MNSLIIIKIQTTFRERTWGRICHLCSECAIIICISINRKWERLGKINFRLGGHFFFFFTKREWGRAVRKREGKQTPCCAGSLMRDQSHWAGSWPLLNSKSGCFTNWATQVRWKNIFNEDQEYSKSKVSIIIPMVIN